MTYGGGVKSTMKKSVTTLLLLLASPIVLWATPAQDRKIEDAAKNSFNYRTVLDDQVKVKAKDGVVTLSGTVQDKDARALAVDTVENLPGVTSVNNEIEIAPAHEERSDAWIALKIRGRLLVKGNVSATATKVAVSEGVVTLSGEVDNLAQKELTAIYAAEIEGVRSVNNELVVDSTPEPADLTLNEKIDDASITSQVKYALLTHKSTSALKTKVSTADGVVTISGNADSDAEKSLVTKLASDVRGAKSVLNNMVVKG